MLLPAGHAGAADAGGGPPAAAARRRDGAHRRTPRSRAIERASGGAVVAVVRTAGGRIATAAVVNAAGTWAGDVAALAGVDLPVRPRRGFILVTEPLPALVRHKVYAAEYVANVASGDSDLQTSAVVEGTRRGTVLIGASRERVGFDRTFVAARRCGRLAAQAIDLFPFLGRVHAIRALPRLPPVLARTTCR